MIGICLRGCRRPIGIGLPELGIDNQAIVLAGDAVDDRSIVDSLLETLEQGDDSVFIKTHSLE